MLNFPKEEITAIEEARHKITEEENQKAKKGGILGGFNKKRKRWIIYLNLVYFDNAFINM